MANDIQFKERLVGRIQVWREEGLIDEDSAQALIERENGLVVGFLAAIRLRLAIAMLAVVGAIAVGSGVILLMAANVKAGEGIPTYVETALLLSAVLAAYGAGYVLRFRTSVQPRLGDAFILLGALLFQASIFLIAQIYNVPTDDSTLLLLATAGILPLAYLMCSRFVLFLGLVELVAWLVWRQTNQHLGYDVNYDLPVLLLGIVIYFAGRLHTHQRSWRILGGPYVVVGLSVVLASTFVLTFNEIWHQAADFHRCNGSYCRPNGDSVDHVIAILFPIAGLAALAPAALARFRSRVSNGESLVAAGLLALVGAAVARPWLPLAIPFNAVFFVAALGATFLGYMRADNKPIYLGLAAVAVGLFARYAETSWDILPRSGFFITGGAMLMALSAALEVVRRRVLTGAAARLEAMQ